MTPAFPAPREALVARATLRRQRQGLALLSLFTLSLLLAMTSLAQARGAPDSFADLVEKVAPAVVTVATTRTSVAVEGGPRGRATPFPPDAPFNEFFERFFKRDQVPGLPDGPRRHSETGVGSGFILDAEGIIVTNNHVIDEAASIEVTLKDGRAFPAQVVG